MPVMWVYFHWAALVWIIRTPVFFSAHLMGPLLAPGPPCPCVAVGLHVDDGSEETGAMVLQCAGELSGTSRSDSHFSCLRNLLGVHRNTG